MTEPLWPIIVFEAGGADIYERRSWYGDADLCDAGTWDDGTVVIDSAGQVFRIEHRVLRKGRWLGLVPYQEVSNEFVRTGEQESPEGLLERLRATLGANVTEVCSRGVDLEGAMGVRQILIALGETA